MFACKKRWVTRVHHQPRANPSPLRAKKARSCPRPVTMRKYSKQNTKTHAAASAAVTGATRNFSRKACMQRRLSTAGSRGKPLAALQRASVR